LRKRSGRRSFFSRTVREYTTKNPSLCALLGLALVARATSPVTASAQQGTRVVRGVVTDTAGRPVPWVNLRVGYSVRVLSNDSGHFHLPLRDRQAVTIDLRRIGYLPAELRLDAGGDTVLAVTLIPTAVALPTAVVQADARIRNLERRGFYQRMADREKGINTGHFITQEDIERRNTPPRVTSLFEGIPSVKVYHAKNGWTVPMGVQSGGCVMTTYLDGVRMRLTQEERLSSPTGFYQRGGRSAEMPPPSPIASFDDVIRSGNLAGIEVYPRGNQAPPQYQTLSGSCGVILLWTK
jgi:hypothetical protein